MVEMYHYCILINEIKVGFFCFVLFFKLSEKSNGWLQENRIGKHS